VALPDHSGNHFLLYGILPIVMLSRRSGNIIEFRIIRFCIIRFPRLEDSRAWKYQYIYNSNSNKKQNQIAINYCKITTTKKLYNNQNHKMSIIGFDDRLEHQVNRLFDDFVRDLGVTRRGETTRRPNNDRQKWAPLVDVHERDKDYIVTAELPVSHLLDGF